MQTKLTEHSTSTPSHSDTPFSIHETVYANLNTPKIDVPENSWFLAPVRTPVHNMQSYVDHISTALAPPEPLIEEHTQKTDTFFLKDAMDSVDAHNNAWAAVNFEQRYKDYLSARFPTKSLSIPENSPEDYPLDRTSALTELVSMLHHRPVVLVGLIDPECHTHRDVLAEFITQRWELQPR